MCRDADIADLFKKIDIEYLSNEAKKKQQKQMIELIERKRDIFEFTIQALLFLPIGKRVLSPNIHKRKRRSPSLLSSIEYSIEHVLMAGEDELACEIRDEHIRAEELCIMSQEDDIACEVRKASLLAERESLSMIAEDDLAIEMRDKKNKICVRFAEALTKSYWNDQGIICIHAQRQSRTADHFFFPDIYLFKPVVVAEVKRYIRSLLPVGVFLSRGAKIAIYPAGSYSELIYDTDILDAFENGSCRTYNVQLVRSKMARY
jgi:hypothetical protein